MRSGRWVLVGACVTWFLLMAWLIAIESEAATLLVYGLYAVAIAVVVVRIARSRRRGASPADVIAPGLRGLGEVQDIYLGRRPVPPVTYAAPEGTVPELTMNRPDPLDEPVWLVDRHEPEPPQR